MRCGEGKLKTLFLTFSNFFRIYLFVCLLHKDSTTKEISSQHQPFFIAKSWKFFLYHGSIEYNFKRLFLKSNLAVTLLRLGSQYFEGNFPLNRLQKSRTIVNAHIAYFFRIDMCYNITFLNAPIEIGYATGNLKHQ